MSKRERQPSHGRVEYIEDTISTFWKLNYVNCLQNSVEQWCQSIGTRAQTVEV